jgi:hypothetical protein
MKQKTWKAKAPVLRMDNAETHQGVLVHSHQAPPCHVLEKKQALSIQNNNGKFSCLKALETKNIKF